MSDIVIVDSTILLNVLDIPAFNQDRAAVLAEFETLLEAEDHLFLPMAAVLETADHIADLSQGGERRRCALRFRDRILEALRDDPPWSLVEFPEASRLAEWLADFPNNATQELGLSDVSILDAWQTACARHPNQRVYVWTLHRKLQAYDRRP